MASRGVVLSVFLLGLSACTSLSTSPEVRTVAKADAVPGAPYSLPLLQYETKITRTLAQCTERVGTDEAAQTVPAVRFTVKAEALPVLVAGERFSIEYEKLAGPTKITSLTIEAHASGTLKSINATAEDRSAEVISGVAKSAIGIAKLVSGIPGTSASTGVSAGDKMLVCHADAPKALDAVKNSAAALKIKTEALETVTARVTLLTEQARANALGETAKQELLQKLREQTEAAQEMKVAQAAADKAMAAVSVVTNDRAPQRIDQMRGFLELGGTDLTRFMKMVVLADATPAAENSDNHCGIQALEDCLKERLQVVWLLESLTQLPRPTLVDAAQGAIKTDVARKGIFVRPPEPGRMLVCRRAVEATIPCTSAAKEILLITPDGMVPQLGQLRFLPFQNEMFQNNSLVLSVRENGSVEKFEYKNLKAQAELAANAAADLVTQSLGYADARRKARLDDATFAAARAKADREEEIAILEYQINKLTKEQKLSGMADTRVAILEDEINRITREKELEKLTQPAEISELATIKAQEDLSNARAAYYRALAAERKAKDELEGQTSGT